MLIAQKETWEAFEVFDCKDETQVSGSQQNAHIF